MMFLGISEITTPPAPSANAMETQAQQHPLATPRPATTYAQATSAPAVEDCEAKVYHFCETVLRIQNPRQKIQIDRAHRTGAPAPGKTRPIVAKFRDTASKMCVKDSLKQVKLHTTPFKVFEQLAQEVQERRKTLIPVMVQARAEGKRAVLVRDKLFINNQLYKPTTSSR